MQAPARETQVERFANAYAKYCATKIYNGWIFDKKFYFPEVQFDKKIYEHSRSDVISLMTPYYKTLDKDSLLRLEVDLALEIGTFHLLGQTMDLFHEATARIERTGFLGWGLKTTSEIGLVVIGEIYPAGKIARQVLRTGTAIAGTSASTYAETEGDWGRVTANVVLSLAGSTLTVPLAIRPMKGASKADRYVITATEGIVTGFTSWAQSLVTVRDHEQALAAAVFGAVGGVTKTSGASIAVASGERVVKLAIDASIPVRSKAMSPAVPKDIRTWMREHEDFDFPAQRPQEQAKWVADRTLWDSLPKRGRAARENPFHQPIKLLHVLSASRQVSELPIHRRMH